MMNTRTLRVTLLLWMLGWSLLAQPGQPMAQNGAWDGLIGAGREALKVNAFSDAERYFEEALELAERFPPGDPRLGRSLNNLAALYYKQEDYDRAEPLMRRSLAVLEEALGPSNADVAQTQKNLAAIYYLQGNLADAEPLLQASLETLEELHGPNHAFVATVLNHLAVLYQAENRYAEAEPLLQRSLSIWETLLGKNNPDVIRSRDLLARLRDAKRGAETAALPAQTEEPKPLAPDQAEQILALANDAEAAVIADRESAEEASQVLESLVASEVAAANADDADDFQAETATGTSLITADQEGVEFVVYLSTLWSEDEARRYWQALKVEVPDILADKDMELEEVALDGGGGSFYRVLTAPFGSDPEAQEACNRLRSQIKTHDCNVIIR